MKFPDPIGVKAKPEKFHISSWVHQERASGIPSSEAFAKEKEECFALSDGVFSLPHPLVAAELASESAVWVYRLIKFKPYYWIDKKKFCGRVIRTGNWRVFNKRRDKDFHEGVAATLAVVCIAEVKFYVFHVGNFGIYLLRGGKATNLIEKSAFADRESKIALGLKRTAPTPFYKALTLEAGDSIVMLSDGVSDWITVDDIESLELRQSITMGTVSKTLDTLCTLAKKRGSKDNKTVAVIHCAYGEVMRVKDIKR